MKVENLSGGPYWISRKEWRLCDGGNCFVPFGPLCSRIAVVDEAVEKQTPKGSTPLNIATHREAIRLEEFVRRTTNIGKITLHYDSVCMSRVDNPNARGEYDVAIQLYISISSLEQVFGPKAERR